MHGAGSTGWVVDQSSTQVTFPEAPEALSVEVACILRSTAGAVSVEVALGHAEEVGVRTGDEWRSGG